MGAFIMRGFIAFMLITATLAFAGLSASAQTRQIIVSGCGEIRV